MYSFKTISDLEIWNNFLFNFPKALTLDNEQTEKISRYSFIQSYQWLNFQKEFGRKIYRIGIYKNEELIGICGAVVIRAKRGNYLYIRNGPTLVWENVNLAKQLTKYLKTIAKQEKLWFIRMSPLVERNSKEADIINSMNFKNCPINETEAVDTWIMNIEGSEDQIFNKIKKKTRYEIRQAQQMCKAIVSQDSKYIDDFYEIELDTVKRNGWVAFSKNYTKKGFEIFSKDGNATVILIEYDKKYIAGGVFIHFGDQTYYHYGASLTEYRNIPASYLMIWEAIKVARLKGSKYFNFWGITQENSKDNHPWTGLTKFKMKFPGFEQRWIHSKDIPISKKYWLTYLFEKIEKKKKGFI